MLTQDPILKKNLYIKKITSDRQDEQHCDKKKACLIFLSRVISDLFSSKYKSVTCSHRLIRKKMQLTG